MNDIVKAALTPAQTRVAEGLLEGFSNAEIAKRTGLSESDIKQRLRCMYRRFDIQVTGPYGKRITLARQLLCA